MPRSLYTSLLSAILTLVAGAATAHGETTIGVIAGFSGEGAEFGMSYQHGIAMADLPSDTKFVYEDDQFLPAKTVSAFTKLVELQKVRTVLVGDTVTAQAVAPLAKKRNVQLYVWASSAKEFEGNPFVTRLWSSNEVDFNSTRSVIEARGFKKVAFFTSAHTYAHDWGTYLSSHLADSSHEHFESDPPSYQTYILKALHAKVDAFGVCLTPGKNGLFARQLRQLRSSVPMVACNFIESTADVRAAHGALDGALFTGPEISEEFTTRYLEKYGATDHLFSAALFHDAALLAAEVKEPQFAIRGLQLTSSDSGRALTFPFVTYRVVGATIHKEPH